MTVYVHEYRDTKFNRMVRQYLVSDTSVDELRAFAKRIGLTNVRLIEQPIPHYFVTGRHYQRALDEGARPIFNFQELKSLGCEAVQP